MSRVLILVFLLSALTCAPSSSFAADKPVTKQQAVGIAKSQFQGRVIAVNETHQDDKTVYRIKILDKQGGMHTVVVDYQSGQVISAH